MQGAVVNRAGRKRKSGVIRDKNGKSRGEKREKPDIGIVLEYRAKELNRDGVSLLHVADPMAGSCDSLGRLRLRGREREVDGISEIQYLAGQEWARIVRKHARIMGYSLYHIKSPEMELVGKGESCADDPTPEEIADIRDKFRVCYDAVMGACRVFGMGVRNVTYAVCIENVPIYGLSERDLEALRYGLNVLVKALGYEEPRRQIRALDMA